MIDSIREQKQAHRIQMRALRAAVSPEKQAEAGRRIIETVFSGEFPIPAIGRGSVLAMYVSDGGEPDFMPSLPELFRRGIVCCFPAFRKGEMGFYAPTDASDFAFGTFDIREPGLQSAPIDGAQIDVMLVPGLAFDRSGSRLGRGKGFYDRYIASIDPQNRPITIGTGYDFQLLDIVPTQPDDERMDFLVTPDTYYMIRPISK